MTPESAAAPSIADRLAVRERPRGRPVMHQSWGKLLFLHWSLPPEQLRPLLPEGLALDTFEGRGWIGVTPFTMWNVRLPLLPALPWVSETHELNVRTYVHRNGVPGIWFLSLDASNPLAVAGARLTYNLPYYRARMKLVEDRSSGRASGDAGHHVPEGTTQHFSSRRRHPGAPDAHFEARWRMGAALPPLEPGSLDFFLIERYVLFSVRGGRLHHARIHHRPWEVGEAEMEASSSSMIAAQGLPEPELPALLHAQREPLHVQIWPLRKV